MPHTRFFSSNISLLSLLAIVATLFSLPAAEARAASVTASTTRVEVRVGEEVPVDIFIDVDGHSINAVSGELRFDADIVEPRSFTLQNSVFSLWPENPRDNGSNIGWGAVAPGGFDGVRSPFYEGARPGRVLRMYFVASTTGDAKISLENIIVYDNDGLGTHHALASTTLALRVMPGDARLAYVPGPRGSESVQAFQVEPSIAAEVSSNRAIWDIIIAMMMLGAIALYFKKRWHR